VVREGTPSFDGRATAGDVTATTPTVSGALAGAPLNLRDFEIGGLSRLLGMLRMYEDIMMYVDVSLACTGDADTGPGVS
jgi:hypothetical protein